MGWIEETGGTLDVNRMDGGCNGVKGPNEGIKIRVIVCGGLYVIGVQRIGYSRLME